MADTLQSQTVAKVFEYHLPSYHVSGVIHTCYISFHSTCNTVSIAYLGGTDAVNGYVCSVVTGYTNQRRTEIVWWAETFHPPKRYVSGVTLYYGKTTLRTLL